MSNAWGLPGGWGGDGHSWILLINNVPLSSLHVLQIQSPCCDRISVTFAQTLYQSFDVRNEKRTS